MATLEELESRLDEVEGVLSAEYAPVDGPELSYPAVGQAVDDEMWKFITLAIGSGILDDGGYGYWLRGLGSDSETNQASQMRLTVAETTGTAEAILKGFYHRLLEDMRLDFPMPLSETTYYVVLELNPLKAKSAGGPISVKVYPNELNTESGREHLVLWTVTRRPNQLLTDATIVRYRPRVTPTLSVLTWEHLPDPSTVLYGTVAFVYGDNNVAIARGANNAEGGATRWDSMLDAAWTEVGDGASYGWPGHGYKRGYRRFGNTAELRGRIKRTNNTAFVVGGGNESAGYRVFNLPASVTPKRELRFITATNNFTGNRLACVTIDPEGAVFMTPILGDCSWISLDGIRYALDD